MKARPIPLPSTLGLPYDAWRPGQRLAIRTALHTKRPHVLINAPTGAGKSIIAAALTRLDERRQVVLTETKALQEQYRAAFPFLVDIRGMSNYECLAARDEFKDWFPRRRTAVHCDDGPCHDGEKCTLREDGCLYYDAYRRAMGAQAVLPNYHYWLSMRRYGSGLGVAQRLICDEAHALPELLMSSCRVELPRMLIDTQLPRSYQQWRTWATQQLDGMSEDDLRRKPTRIVASLKTLSHMDETWAWDATEDAIVFEPTVPRLLMPLLQTFDEHTNNVYLSATVTTATLALLGVEEDQIDALELASQFPVERRPVILVPGARVDYRTMQRPEVVAQWLDSIRELVLLREDRNGIVHPVSFSRAWQIAEALRGQVPHAILLHRSGQPAAEIVEQFKRAGTKGPALLISPSVMTGFDFPYRQCEFQILAKMPFPDTRSTIVKARMKATSGYREHLTMQQFIQACGRGMRAADDQCECLVVDEHSRWFLRDNRELMPGWFAQAVVSTRRTNIRPPTALA